jgi:DNA adenine methylase
VPRVRNQVLKWIGNKQRFAHEICGYFPEQFATYYEPFLGSGAVLATLAPEKAVASDVLAPLIGIWQHVVGDPEPLVVAYGERRERFMQGDRKIEYGKVRDAYNRAPNPYDLVFLSRSCYGGVIRFSKKGAMNTPCGPHKPVTEESFRQRVQGWRPRLTGAEFVHADFETTINRAQRNDLVYCDPPYADSETTLYGAQSFSLARLFEAIGRAKRRGARIAVSIDGTKRSGTKRIPMPVPEGLFETTVMVNCGRSMLRRFQMQGQTLEGEVVADRLLLTWRA